MAYSHFERLSALDASFLEIEDATTHMHIGAVAIFEAGPVSTPDGGVDIERMRRLMDAGMYRIPRYRQRLARVPLFGNPVWVDDQHFNLAYHLRHTHLPRPGDERALKRLAGRIMSQQLDRNKPLWEMWVVEGLAENRFAIVTKAHHCMIDGIGSVELTGTVMRPTPDEDPRLAEPSPRWVPRGRPSDAELFLGEVMHRASAPAALLRRLATDPMRSSRATGESVLAIAEALGAGLHSASPSPFNVPIGPHRRFDWLAMDLEAVKDIRRRLGGTVNDVVLALLSGALRRYLFRRGDSVEGLDFRAMLPVNVRTAASREDMGNRVAMMTTRLPLEEHGARARLEHVVEETRRSKASHQAAGTQAIEELSDTTFTTLFSQFARLTALVRPFNLVVTNVPGPPFPVYVLGARMLACYPLVPLFANQALGVALFSYDGRLFWGLNSDWDVLPDLHELVEALEREMHDLAEAASCVAPAEAAAS